MLQIHSLDASRLKRIIIPLTDGETTRKKAPARCPLDALDQFSAARDDGLERALDLLGERRLLDQGVWIRAVPFFPGRFLRPLRHSIPPRRGPAAAFLFYVAV